jgi:hypothetical protein
MDVRATVPIELTQRYHFLYNESRGRLVAMVEKLSFDGSSMTQEELAYFLTLWLLPKSQLCNYLRKSLIGLRQLEADIVTRASLASRESITPDVIPLERIIESYLLPKQ